MPKSIVNEELLQKRASCKDEGDSSTALGVEAKTADRTRELDGLLSEYKPARCLLDEEKLSGTSRLVLSELGRIGAAHLVIDYEGGGDEGFAYSCAAQTPNETKDLEQLAQLFEQGPLGEAPPFLQSQSNTLYDFSIYEEVPLWRTRRGGTLFRIECLFDELVHQLFGREFGMEEGGLKGSFIADLQSHTLTEIAREEE